MLNLKSPKRKMSGTKQKKSQQLSFLGRNEEHVLKRDVVHNLKASASYKIGNTQVVCGITSEIKQHIQDGNRPILFDVRLENSGLAAVESSAIAPIAQWIGEIVNDDDLFSNKQKLIVETEDKQSCFYQRVHLVLYIIDDDGKVFDVALYAVVVALLSLRLNELVIGNDGICSFSLSDDFLLQFNYHPIPFTILLKEDDVTLSTVSFVLTETEINHIHIHGGRGLISPDVLIGCIEKCRPYYENRKKTLLKH